MSMGITDRGLLKDVMSRDGITGVTFRCKCGNENEGTMKNHDIAQSRVEMHLTKGTLIVDVPECEKCV